MSDDTKDPGDKAEDAAGEFKKDAKKAADELKGDAKKAADEIKEDAKKAADELKDDAKKVADEIKEDVKKAAHEFKEDAKKASDEFKEEAREFKEDAKKAASEFAEEAKKSAEEFSEGLKSAAGGENKKILAGVLAIVLGSLGVHKFILGYQKEGIILLVITVIGMVLSCIGIGIFLVWATCLIGLIEGIIYLTKSDEEFYNTYQAGRKPWF